MQIGALSRSCSIRWARRVIARSGSFKDAETGDKGLVTTMGDLKSLFREGFFLQRQHEKTH